MNLLPPKHRQQEPTLKRQRIYLGCSGSGKSFAAKMEILMSALFSNDDIIVIDVEREYGSLIRNLGGDEFVCISESNVLPYISQFKDTVSFIDREKLYKLAVSIGYSRFHEKYSKSIDDIICRADEKMYKAKKDKK